MTSTLATPDTRPRIERRGFVYAIEMAGDASKSSYPVIGMIPDTLLLDDALTDLLPEGGLEGVQGPDITGCFIVSIALDEEPANIDEILSRAFARAVLSTCAARLDETLALSVWARNADGEMEEVGDFDDDRDEAQRVAERLALKGETRLVPCGEDWRNYPAVAPREQTLPRRSSSLSS
jgi:hypothetical protein